MSTTATILALDASSTTVGWVLFDQGVVRDHSEIRLADRDIHDRLSAVSRVVGNLLDDLLRHERGIDAVAIESPVGRFTKAIIPQAFVSGVIRLEAHRRGLAIVDIAPAEAKQALTGKGNADKSMMRGAALVWGVNGEHAADAVGVALAAVRKVQVTR